MAVIEHDPSAFKGDNHDYPIIEAALKEHCERLCALAYGICQIGSIAGRGRAIDDMMASGVINSATRFILHSAFMGL